jgi:hypothetical protein
MIADALKAFAENVARSLKPERLQTSDPYAERFVINGKVETVDVPPPPRNHAAGSLDEIIALANRFKASACYGEPAVWYDHASVVLVIDDEDDEGCDARRLSRATLTLEPSDVWQTIVTLRKNPGAAWLEHGPFLRLLRIDLAGTQGQTPLAARVAKVRFENGAVTTAERVANKGESLGREIISKVGTDVDLPDAVTLSAPVYKTPGETERRPVRCSFEVDPGHETFRLMPLPDEIEHVRYLAISSIRDRLEKGLKGVPFYFGKP